MSKDKFWKVLETKEGFKGDWIDLNLDKIELPDGSNIIFEALRYHRNGAAIAAENSDGKIVLIKSYRYINDFTGWELPAGTVPPDRSPAECVVEELLEEAGCKTSIDSLEFLGEYYPSIGASNQLFSCFYTSDVEVVTDELDKNEILDRQWFSRDELKNMIMGGEIMDGFTLYVLMRVLFMK